MPITKEVVDQAPHLRIIAHAAGSVKKVITPAVFERGIVVTTSAMGIAAAVAENTVLLSRQCA